MAEPLTLVIFRTWKAGIHKGDVTAIFPEMKEGRYLVCYQHIGQHGTCDYVHMLEHTRPSTNAEAEPLRTELAEIGYNVRQVRRYAAALRKLR